MDFRVLERSMIDLADRCDALIEVLEAERQAMKAWQADRITALADEKELLLEAVSAADQALKARIDETLLSLDTTADQLFALPGAARLRELRARIEGANQTIRRQGELNRQLALHLIDFLRRVQGAPPVEPVRPAYGYAPRYPALTGDLVHHIF
jgi:flagellar biosynthesis/type III secretory pathway chaperone